MDARSRHEDDTPQSERSAERRPILTYIDGSGLQATYVLTKHETIFGRSHSADVQITGGGVSRAHAAIAYTNFHQPTEMPDCLISDCGSRNGTFLNGRRLSDPLPLSHGDKILIDNTMLVFQIPNPEDPVSNESLQRITTTDNLTGLMNQDFMEIRSHREIDRSTRYGRPLALLVVVVDEYSALVARHGMPAGEMVLRRVARLLAGEIRTFDMAARTSISTFSLLLPETDGEGAMVLADRIRGDIATHPFTDDTGGNAVPVSVSIGIATATPAATLKTLTRNSMEALAAARANGGGQIVVARNQ